MDKPAPVGRPSLPPEERAGKRMAINLTDAEKTEVTRAARMNGVSQPGTWAKRIVLAAARREIAKRTPRTRAA